MVQHALVKTSLSINLAENLNTEILSADSRQIYKHINIGTAKPTIDETKGIKHHFIDYLELDEVYNVSRFENESLEICNKLINNNKIPIVVGGSGLYIKAIVDGIIDEVETNEELREELLKIKNEDGNEKLYELLEEIDSKAAEALLQQNWKRVIRAIEVYKLSGKSIIELHSEQKRKVDLDFYQFGLMWDREILYKRIEDRVDKMINDGLVEEVEKVLQLGIDKGTNSLNTVGYKENYRIFR